MSDEHIAIVRRLFASWNAHRPESTVEYFAEDLEFDARDLPMPDIARIYRGREGLAEWAGAWLSAWEHLQGDPIWIRANATRTVAWVHMSMIGKGSGAPVEVDGAWGFTFHDGTISHVRLMVAEDEAVEYLEQGGEPQRAAENPD